jgi:hypothetical protein
VKRRRVILILLACLMAGVVAFIVWPGEREPEYQGKKLSEWLTLYSQTFSDESGRKEAHASAAQAVRHIGTNAIPYLLKWIRYETPDWRNKLESHIEKLP